MQRDVPPSRQSIMFLHVALTLGILMFGGFCIYKTPPGDFANFSILVIGGLAAAAGAMGGSAFVPNSVANAQIQALARASDDVPDETSLLSVYQTAAIIGAAILEGAAFLNLVVYLLDANPINLGVAAALAIGILMRIPSQHALDSWVDAKRRDIQQGRAGL